MRDKEILMRRLTIMLGIVFVASFVFLSAADVPTYVGVAKCRDCHKTEKQGKAYPIWEASKHAQSFNILKTETAKTEAGEQKPPQQSPACLKCHAPLHEKAKDVCRGHHLRGCHGPGGLYRSSTSWSAGRPA
jgi:hypothetical protein